MTIKKCPANRLQGVTKNSNLNNTHAAAQRQRLLERLRHGHVTTVDARHVLNILAPAARIYELRHYEGHKIITYWTYDVTPEGYKHRVARYVLMQENCIAGDEHE